MTTRVLVVDDHPIFREGLCALLATLPGFEVVGQAGSGEEAIRATHATAPDLVVMDIRMPGMGGLEATRRIQAECPGVRIVILTVSEAEDDLFEAVRAGAQGYALKNLDSAAVLDLLSRAAAGEPAFTPALAARALQQWAHGAAGGVGRLSQREREVLRELVTGATNAAIAQTLGLSESTVRFHLRNILSKLHAQSRTEAAIRALREGIVAPPDE